MIGVGKHVYRVDFEIRGSVDINAENEDQAVEIAKSIDDPCVLVGSMESLIDTVDIDDNDPVEVG